MPTTIKAAKTRGTLKLELATSITLPIPALPATISAMTEPTKANVIAIFSEAKDVEKLRFDGREAGRHVNDDRKERQHKSGRNGGHRARTEPDHEDGD